MGNCMSVREDNKNHGKRSCFEKRVDVRREVKHIEENSISVMEKNVEKNVEIDDVNDVDEFTDSDFVFKTNFYSCEITKYVSKQLVKNHRHRMMTNVRNNTFFTEIKINRDELTLFNKILKIILRHCDINVIKLLTNVKDYFDDFEPSYTLIKYMKKYILKKYNEQHVWHDLSVRKDYNTYLYEKRRLPYFKIESKEWKQSVINAFSDYDGADNNTNTHTSNTHTSNTHTSNTHTLHTSNTSHMVNDFAAAINIPDIDNIVIKDNNYMAWKILDVKKYKLDLSDAQCLLSLGYVKYALLTICMMMINPSTCHVIKERLTWCIINKASTHRHRIGYYNDIEKLVSYCMYFAQYILRQEETIIFGKVILEHRFVFSLEQAYRMKDIGRYDDNPYCIQLTKGKNYRHHSPFNIYDGKRSINDRKKFMHRLGLATGNALVGIDFAAYRAAVTGSILVPCAHESPLERYYKGNDDIKRNNKNCSSEDIAFLHYLSWYYPGYESLSETDRKKLTTCDMSKYENRISTNKITYQNDDGIDVIDDEKKETLPILVRKREEKDKKDKKDKINYHLADIDISINTIDHSDFIIKAVDIFKQIRENCKHRGEIYMEEIRTISSTKYKIFGPGLCRPIDLFRTYQNPIQMVKRFHMNCVKMYYDGNIYLMRSCVSSLLSGVCEKYKWFSCNKVPVHVILKYAHRGFSCVLNTKEITSIENYLKKDNPWGKYIRSIKSVLPDKNILTFSCWDTHLFFHSDNYNKFVRTKQITKGYNNTNHAFEYPHNRFGSIWKIGSYVDKPSTDVIFKMIDKTDMDDF